MKYIQAAVSDNDHAMFSRFAQLADLTMNELIETAIKHYINTKGKEVYDEIKDLYCN